MQIDFWTQAGLDVGMGHLSRCAQLYKKFLERGCAGTISGSFDSEALNFARFHSIPISEAVQPSQNHVIIDGVKFESWEVHQLSEYEVRGSLTLLEEHPALPTHYFLRSEPAESRREDAEYIIHPSFVFNGPTPTISPNMRFDEIHVGVCLSAGKELDEWQIVEEVLSSPRVKTISVISRKNPKQAIVNTARVRHSAPISRPWDFFDSVNVVVVGDGVMVGEAVVRGLPVISVTDERGQKKNRALHEAGVVSWVKRSPDFTSHVAKRAVDAPLLRRLRTASVAYTDQIARTEPADIIRETWLGEPIV